MKTLDETLRDARKAKGLSLRALGEIIGFSASYVSEIENSRRSPSEEVIGKMAAALDLDPLFLMALAGRIRESTERWMKRHPSAFMLIEACADCGLADHVMEIMILELRDGHERGRNDHGAAVRS